MATSSTSKFEHVSINVTCINQLKRVHSQASEAGADVLAVFGCNDENSRLTVVGCARCTTQEQFTALTHRLPGGIHIYGVAYVGSSKEDFDPTKCSNQCSFILSEMLGDEGVVIYCHGDKQEVSVSKVCVWSPSGAVSEVAYQMTSEKFLQNCVIARASCYIPFTFTLGPKGQWEASVGSEMESLCAEVCSPSTTFHLQSSNVLLAEGWSNGIPEQASCGDLASYVDSPEAGIRKRKAGKSQKTLLFDVYTDLSGAETLERTPSCAPVIHYNTEKVRMVSIQLPVDAVALVDPQVSASDLSQYLCVSICRRLSAMERCICQHSKGEKFVIPMPYHFNPMDTEMLYTIVNPHGFADSQLESYRQELHQSLCLPTDRPLFRLANRYAFPEDQESSGYLLNVHESVGPSKVSGGTQYLVKGHYTYHHYMQDRFDDNKWGCAYRSLQTLVSWFRLQGYSDRPIPDHNTIQQTLVDIGDKEPSFVGSKKWIGSMEVSFVLDTILGVTSKILSVSAGAELASKGRELAAHFMSQGTPIMIGGGVLANTILGVDYNEITGDIGFLILDPHYTGGEDLKVIVDKGWCGWKGPEFWDKHAHYNMCLPQRPTVI